MQGEQEGVNRGAGHKMGTGECKRAWGYKGGKGLQEKM